MLSPSQPTHQSNAGGKCSYYRLCPACSNVHFRKSFLKMRRLARRLDLIRSCRVGRIFAESAKVAQNRRRLLLDAVHGGRLACVAVPGRPTIELPGPRQLEDRMQVERLVNNLRSICLACDLAHGVSFLFDCTVVPGNCLICCNRRERTGATICMNFDGSSTSTLTLI